MQIEGLKIDVNNVMDKLIEENQNRRSRIKKYDNGLICENNRRIRYEDLLDEHINNGRIKIKYKETEYESIFIRQTSEKIAEKKLYVILNGYRPANAGAVFKRWTWYTFIDGDLLNIDDPMCNKDYPELCLGWYWGNKEISYRHEIVEIVKQFIAKYGYGKVVYYASSGGGSAALHCAQIHEGSTSIVINPQIDLSLHVYYPKFHEITQIDVMENDIYHRNSMWNIKAFKKSNFIFCENMLAKSDRIQVTYLLEKMGIKDLHMGINRISSNGILWLYEAEGISPHDSQEWPAMFQPIIELDKLFSDQDTLKSDYNALIEKNYLGLTELWYEQFHMQQEIKRMNRKIFVMDKIPSFFRGNTMGEELFVQKLILNKATDRFACLIPHLIDS